MKTFFRILIGLLVVIIIGIAAFLFTFDPNQYKDQMTELVEQQTGRDLTIDGKISLSVFPWIGLEVGKLKLSNAKGFSNNDFARIDRLDVKIKLLPLLKRDVEIDKVRLHGLFASLETHADGKTNWQDLAQSKNGTGEASSAVSPETPAAEAGTGSAPALAGLLVNGIELVGAKLQWLDDKSGTHATVSGLNLETGAIAFEQWVPVSFSAKVVADQPQVDAGIQLDTRLKFNHALNVFEVDNLKLGIDTLMKAIAAERVRLDLLADAHADMQQHSARLSNFKASAFGAELMADVSVKNFDVSPEITGNLSTNQINLRALAKHFGVDLPVSANPQRLEKFSLQSRVVATPQAAKLESVEVHLDDSTLSGFVNVPDIAKQRVRYQLKLDVIDVDSYLPPPVVATDADAPAPAVPAEDIEIALPVDLMRALDIEGEFTIGTLRVQAIDINAFRLVTKASQGVIALSPISMKLLQGEMNAETVIDVQQASRYSVKLNASNLAPESLVNPMLKGLLGDQETSIAGGSASLTVDVKTSGQWLSELKRAATGSLRVDVNKTVLTGVDIEYFVRNSVADYLTEKRIDVSSDWRGTYRPREKTAFENILATGKLSEGQLVNDQLAIDSSRVKVNGSGVIDLMKNTIDEKLEVVLNMARQEKVADKVIAQPVPVHIHGPFAQLAFDVDKTRLATTVGAIIRAESAVKAAELKAAADAKAAAAKAEAQQKLDEKKQALKQQEEAKKEAQKKAVEDKLKNKLKGLFN